jgi:hypothetical protein
MGATGTGAGTGTGFVSGTGLIGTGVTALLFVSVTGAGTGAGTGTGFGSGTGLIGTGVTALLFVSGTGFGAVTLLSLFIWLCFAVGSSFLVLVLFTFIMNNYEYVCMINMGYILMII